MNDPNDVCCRYLYTSGERLCNRFFSSQESYAMLHKYELSVAKEEADKVDTLRYTWEKLLSRSTEVQNELVALQPNFRGELISNVETFLEDCQHFYQDYDKVKETAN